MLFEVKRAAAAVAEALRTELAPHPLAVVSPSEYGGTPDSPSWS